MENEIPYLSDINNFLDKFDNFLLDCDGVLWLGNKVIEGIPNTLEMLRKLGKKIVFVTNNSTQSRADYQKKLSGFGIRSEISEIYTSGYAAATYLKKRNFNKKAYIIGEAGLGKEFDLNGITWRGISEHAVLPKDLHDVSEEVQKVDNDIGAIVVGMDKYFTYTKISFALHHLLTIPDCLFIATNTDETLPTPFGVLPGSGSIVRMLETSYGKPPIVCGKPELSLLDLVLEEHSMDRNKTIMVGDKLSTDILWGNNGKLSTLLVLTGVTSKSELLSKENQIIPSYYIDSFSSLNKT